MPDNEDLKDILDEIFKHVDPVPAMTPRSLDKIVEEYQSFVNTTNLHGEQANTEGEILELVAEAGEVLGVLQKAKRHGREVPRDRLFDELSDVLWGLFAILGKNQWVLADLIAYNTRKLTDRLETAHSPSPKDLDNV